MKNNVIFCGSLEEAFSQASLPFPKQPIVPEKFMRFSTAEKAHDLSGWCKLFEDGLGAVFGCHRAGASFIWQRRDAGAAPPTKAEQHHARLVAARARQQAERDLAADHAAAAETAARILSVSTELDPAQAYVVRKGIIPYSARQSADGAIVLPVHGPDGTLQSLQFIRPDGQKRFLPKGKMTAGRLFLGCPSDGLPMTLVEGWATGCSAHEASGGVIVVCFSGANLDDVAADLRRQFPGSPLFVAGDLDVHGKGRDYAEAAASAGAPAAVLLPTFADGRDRGDFNDLAQAEGIDSVRQQLAAAADVSNRAVASFLAPALPTCDVRDGTTDSRALTEYGNAQRLFDDHGDKLRYVYDADSWICWHGGAWKWDDGSGVRSLSANLAGKIYSEGSRHLADAEHFGRWARKSQEQRVINAVVGLLSDFPRVRLPHSCLDADPLIVGLDGAKQVIVLRTGTQRPAASSDYVTKTLGVASVGDAAKAVRWLQFLDQVFKGDMEMLDWLQRFCGYLLTGSTQEQVFLFCFGLGANGKSVFIEVLKHVMGDYGRAIAPETLSESRRQAGGATPDLAALIGARLVVSSETEDNAALAESLVKSLVSGDSMAVRRLYAAPMQFTPCLKLVMAGNHKPIVKGNDHGIWRRVRLVPFNRTFAPDERDPRLLDKLKAEAPHILAWMVVGCMEWQRRGLADTPAVIRQATDAYQVDQDLTGRWLDECTTPNKYGETSSGDLYASYKGWCVENGLHPVSSVALGRRISERGYEQRKSHGKRIWRGLLLTSKCRVDSGAYARMKGT
jgi:P4 family phage/plasmid primase-like protien